MTFLIIITLFLYVFRFEYIYPLNDSLSSIIGLSALKYLAALSFLFLCSIYYPLLTRLLTKSRKRVLYVSTGLFCLLFIVFYEYEKILADRILIMLFLLFIVLFAMGAERFLSGIQKKFPLKPGEIEKAFVTYPPNKFSDFAIFYAVTTLLLLMPVIAKAIWSGNS